jgi:hypothetical protein
MSFKISDWKNAWDWTKEKASVAGEAMKDKIEESKILDKAAELGGNLYEKTKEAAEAAKEKAKETGEAITTSVQAHKPDLDALTEAGKEKLKSLADKIKK